MKITDPDVIKNGEKELIDAVTDDLDLDVVRQILEKKIAATALAAKGGQIVVHNNEIAFKLDFDLNLSGSLMFDREGNYISDADIEDEENENLSEASTFEEAITGQTETGDTELEDTDLESAGLDADSLDTDDISEEKPEDDLQDVADDIEPALTENAENDLDVDLDDDLKINLPDYSLDEEEFPDPLMTQEETEPADDGPEDLGDFDALDDIPLLEDESSEDDIIPDGIIDDDGIQRNIDDDDLVDDDINDILKESQEFWDQKKDS